MDNRRDADRGEIDEQNDFYFVNAGSSGAGRWG